MSNRLYYMDILRLISVALVMFGHFVMVGSFAHQIPGIIKNENILPLINADSWRMWWLDVTLVGIFHTQAAVLGVLMFFLITGYLIPMMQDRYSRGGFIINRVFRIFPSLIFSVFLVGFFSCLTQGIKFCLDSYLSSITLTYLFLGVVPVIGVLWTLVVEILFYSIAFFVGKFNKINLFILQIILLTVIYFSTITDNYIVNLVAINCKYLLFILIGTAVKLSEATEKMLNKIILLLSSSIFSYAGFHLYMIDHIDTTVYPNIGSQILSLAIFLFFYSTKNITMRLFKKIPSLFYRASDLVYPLYLLHASIGLEAIALAKNFTNNPYFLLLIGISVTFLFALCTNKFIENPGIFLGKKIIKNLSNFKV